MVSNKLREDEMWCPECGAPIKKGFFTCSNCKLKVKLTKEINNKQYIDLSTGSTDDSDKKDDTDS